MNSAPFDPNDDRLGLPSVLGPLPNDESMGGLDFLNPTAAEPDNVVTEVWKLTNHVCRVCFGRVLRKPDRTAFMCSCCETSETTLRDLCACGWKFNDVGSGKQKRKGVNMGVRCIKNPNRSPLSPSIIVAAEV